MQVEQSRRAGQHRRPSGDGLLFPLRRHWLWTIIGLVVAGLAAGTRFAAIGVLPPSVKMKAFGHATGSTELVLGEDPSFKHSVPDKWGATLAPRAYALADMAASPEVEKYIALAAGLPASKVGIMGPLWTELQRSQQWATGPKRASQIIIESDPYQITLDVQATTPPWPPVIDIQTQAPSTQTAGRLANAVVVGLSAYVAHLQSRTGVPKPERYHVSQLAPLSVAPAPISQLASVGAFTFIAVFVLWCGGFLALSALIRDIRDKAAAPKVGDDFDRSSNAGPLLVGTD